MGKIASAQRQWPGAMGRKPVTVAPFPSDRRDFIASALNGRMTPEDQAYMARAILQMSEEIAELREAMRGIQMALADRGRL